MIEYTQFSITCDIKFCTGVHLIGCEYSSIKEVSYLSMKQELGKNEFLSSYEPLIINCISVLLGGMTNTDLTRFPNVIFHHMLLDYMYPGHSTIVTDCCLILLLQDWFPWLLTPDPTVKKVLGV